jgi:hypothetical protein
MTEVAPEPGGEAALTEKAGAPPLLTRPAYRLASPGQVGIAGLLGGPLGGFLLMGRN